jgi:hypothetical protein
MNKRASRVPTNGSPSSTMAASVAKKEKKKSKMQSVLFILALVRAHSNTKKGARII